jgi:iron complex outermembrane receptor protein
MRKFDRPRNHIFSIETNISILILSASVLSSPAYARADTSSSNSGELGEIVVTAQKRQEDLQKVPLSITALSSQQLQASGIIDTSQLAAAVSGVSIHSTGQALQPHVRGVGTSAIGAGVENPVALYVDNVYIAAQVEGVIDFVDVTQVAVLKGPQGTLFGRNATGGVIQLSTRDPLDHFSGQIRTEIDNYATARGNVYLTGPLAQDVTANLSLSGAHQGRGWGENIATGEERDKIYHDLSARAKIHITPGSDTSIKLAADYRDRANSLGGNRSLVKGTTLNFAPPPPTTDNRWDVDAPFISHTGIRGGGASAQIDQQLGFATLTSTSAYRDSRLQSKVDSSLSRVSQVDIQYDQHEKTLTQELQLVSPDSSAIKWATGLYFFRGKALLRDGDVTVYGLPTVIARTNGSQTTHSYSVFGQATVPVMTDNTHVTLGGRYTTEKRRYSGYQQISIGMSPFFFTDIAGVPVASIDQAMVFGSQKANKFTFRAAIDQKLTPDILGYASFNRGFKSGGFNLFRADAPPFRPESIDSWEAGFKGKFADNRIRLNVAGFYNTYRDIQVQKFVGPSAIIVNGAKARFYGVDAEAEVAIGSELLVQGGVEWLNARFTDYPDADILQPVANGTSFGPVSGSAAGRAVPYAPNFTGNIRLTWTKEMQAGTLQASVSDAYTSTVYAEPSNFLKTDPYHMVSASLNWTSASGITVSLWGRNLLNKAVPSLQFYGFPIGFGEDYANPPRTFGATLTLRFGAQ